MPPKLKPKNEIASCSGGNTLCILIEVYLILFKEATHQYPTENSLCCLITLYTTLFWKPECRDIALTIIKPLIVKIANAVYDQVFRMHLESLKKTHCNPQHQLRLSLVSGVYHYLPMINVFWTLIKTFYSRSECSIKIKDFYFYIKSIELSELRLMMKVTASHLQTYAVTFVPDEGRNSPMYYHLHVPNILMNRVSMNDMVQYADQMLLLYQKELEKHGTECIP